MNYKLILGTIVNPLEDKKVEYFIDGAMLLKAKKDNGKLQYKVKWIGKTEDMPNLKKSEIEVLDFSGHVILPGFYDMHFHWVQDDVRLMPKASLLTWLDKYTFPTEQKFANSSYARKKAISFFKELIKTGTVGGACYSSIHSKALDYAFENAKGHFIIGNVTMTINSPKKLTQTKNEAIKLVKDSLRKYKKRYAFTPRFAIATDAQTMKEGSLLAKKAGAFIQTHLSENHDEIKAVMNIYTEQKKFKNVKSYTEIYDKCKVLGPKTIMGHGIHLSNEEVKLLAKTNTAIAHCPTSNAPVNQKGLGSGLFDFRKVEKHNIFWALASDIGGGPFVSMFDVMRSFVVQNRKDGISSANFTKALYRSTLAGANILGIEKKHGNLSKGKFADFIVVKKPSGNYKKAEDLLEKIVMKHDKNRKKYDQMVSDVFLKGIQQ